MPASARIQLTIEIAAPVHDVFRRLIEPASYQDWTSAFAEGSRYEGAWRQGERIRFVGPSGDGMLAEVAELRPNEFVSLRHIGFIVNGAEDTTSDTVRACMPAHENYTFVATPTGTRFELDQSVSPDWEADLRAAWPKALARLKAICEAGASA
ncbi:MAG: SRPBCC domain-containing protein [Candidatus Eisenbacteria bacterium]